MVFLLKFKCLFFYSKKMYYSIKMLYWLCFEPNKNTTFPEKNCQQKRGLPLKTDVLERFIHA